MKAMAKEATDEAKKAMKMAKTPKETKIAKAKAKSARLRHQLAGVDSFSCSMLVLQLAEYADDILADEIEALEDLRNEFDERMLALKLARDNYMRMDTQPCYPAEPTTSAMRAMTTTTTMPAKTNLAKILWRLRDELAGVEKKFSWLVQESDAILAEEIEALEALRDEVDERMLALKQSRDNYSRILKESGWIGGDLWPEVLRRGYFNRHPPWSGVLSRDFNGSA